MAMENICPVLLNIMGYHTENVYYVVVISAKVFSHPVRSKIKIQQTRVQKYDFMFTLMFYVVLFTGELHKKNKQHVHFVPRFRYLTVLPNYIHKNNLCY